MPTLEEQLNMIKNGEITAPFSIELHLTNICNHSCKWCIYDDIMNNDNLSLSYENAIEVINDIKKIGCESIVLSGGGDPLMHKNAEDIMKYACSLGIDIILVTNGGSLKRYNVKKLSEYISLLRISVDAYDDFSYKNIHRPKNNIETFTTLCNSIKDFIDAKTKTKVILSYVLNDESIIGLETFVQKAIDLKVDGIDIKTEHNLTFSNKKLLIKNAQICLKNIGKKSIQIVYDPVKRRKKFVKKLWVGLCYMCIIEANGNVYPCCHTIEESFLLGNTYNENFEKIWYGRNHVNMIKEYFSIKSSCATCSDSSTAKMICRIIEV